MRSNTAPTVADRVAAFLSTRDVRHVFGVPGGENVPLIEALRRAGIEYVLTHHEASAGFAADVTGQLTDRPGVALSTVGPGAVNLLTGAASATLERSPMLALTAEIDPEIRDRVTHMKVDLGGIFQAAAKASFPLRAGGLERTLSEAWEMARTPPRGAVHLSLSPSEAAATEPEAHSAPVTGANTAELETDALDAARAMIGGAGSAVVLAGVGVEAAGAHRDLISIAEAWGAPVAVTPKAKGQFPESHLLYAGCFSAYGDDALRAFLAECDLIIGVGLDGVDFVTSTWEVDTPVLHLGTPPEDTVTRPTLSVGGPLRATLQALKGAREPWSNGIAVASELRRAIRAALHTGYAQERGIIGLVPLTAAIQEALPPEGAVTVDVGAFKLVFLQAWQAERPKRLFVANGLSAMGYALPGALAIRLARPERPALAIVGDGALLMYAGELETVARLGRPLVVLVIVDEALSLIRLKQLRQDVPITGTEFGPTDYALLAAAFGLAYRRIEGAEGAPATLREALNLPHPVLVEARVNKHEYDHFR